MHKVLAVRKPPPGFKEEVVALVTFGYAPTEFDPPIKFLRSVNRAPAGKEADWKQYDIATVSGVVKVKFHDVPVVRNDRGTYLQMQDIEIPREVKAAIAAEAAAQASNLTAEKPTEAAPYVDGPVPSDKDIPF